MRHAPRDYQLASIADFWSRVEAEWRKPILVAPTGSGKTVTGAGIIAQEVAKGWRVIVVVHRRELVEQTSRKLFDAGVEHGIIAAGFPLRPSAPVQVCSIQTLHARAAITADRSTTSRAYRC
jgi:DNA repair protein RadD